jgi:hypothetical protein
MKDNGTSQNYQKANLKAMIHFAEHIGVATSFYDIDHKRIIIAIALLTDGTMNQT